jgi:hypothetical protein
MPTNEGMSVRCLQKYPKPYYSSLKPHKFSDVFDSPVCLLGVYRKEAGETNARAVMALILLDVIEFFNVSNSMNAHQIADTADIIIDHYGYLKIDDFKLCFSNAKMGMYGAVYRMDGQIILSWLKQYLNDRMNAAEEVSYNKHKTQKMDEHRLLDFRELIKKRV